MTKYLSGIAHWLRRGCMPAEKPIRNHRHPTEEFKVVAERSFAGARERIEIELHCFSTKWDAGGANEPDGYRYCTFHEPAATAGLYHRGTGWCMSEFPHLTLPCMAAPSARMLYSHNLTTNILSADIQTVLTGRNCKKPSHPLPISTSPGPAL